MNAVFRVTLAKVPPSGESSSETFDQPLQLEAGEMNRAREWIELALSKALSGSGVIVKVEAEVRP